MNLAELAQHIGMDARELKRLADRGKLPGHQVGGEWRFNRAQMLEWFEREMTRLDPHHVRNLERAMSDEAVDGLVVGSLLAAEAVDMKLPARSRASTLRELVALAGKTGLVWDEPALIEAVEQRESLFSTGLPRGFAFPHPHRMLPYATAEPLLALGRVPAGIPFGAPDGQLTYVFVLLCSHDERKHLRVLARLAMMFATDLPDQLRETEDDEAALALFLAYERKVMDKDK